jgi:DnaJ family protein C protein 7
MLHAPVAQCVADCDKAIELAPTNGKAYFRRASGLKGLGRLDEAIEALQAGLVHEPNSATATQDIKTLTSLRTKLVHAKDLIQKRRFSEALRTVDELLSSLGTTVKDLNMMKVECLLELQRIQEAYNLTNQLMRGASHVDTELLRMRAKCLYEMGDIENAVKHLQQALRSDPDNAPVRTWYRKLKEIEEHKTHGNTAFKAGLYEEAISSWTQAIALDKFHHSINAKLHCNCANAYAKLRKHQEAVGECDKAIRCDPNFIKAYMRRAESNYAIGDERTLQKALE